MNRGFDVIYSQKNDELMTKVESNLSISDNKNLEQDPKERSNGDLETLIKQFNAFREMALPYFNESTKGKWLFAGMVSGS